MDLVENRALLDAYRRGDRDALAAVFDELGPRVASWLSRGFLYSSRGERRRFDGFRSAADVHDCLHEVFRRAFEAKARTAYSGLKSFEGYLFVITRNVVLTRLGKKDADLVEPRSLDEIPSHAPSPEESLARDEERVRVRAFLATLTEDDRQFATLRFVEQQTQADVGKAMGLSRKRVRLTEGAIRSGLVRYLKQTRGALEITEAIHEGSR